MGKVVGVVRGVREEEEVGVVGFVRVGRVDKVVKG